MARGMVRDTDASSGFGGYIGDRRLKNFCEIVGLADLVLVYIQAWADAR
jgi:hypothetical protein